MRKHLNPLWEHEPPKGLYQRVLTRIDGEERLRLIQRRLAFFSLVVIGSSVALLPSLKAFTGSATESGFSTFLSLLFSDADILLAHWQSFSLALLETLPTVSAVVLLTVTTALLFSTRGLAKNLVALDAVRS